MSSKIFVGLVSSLEKPWPFIFAAACSEKAYTVNPEEWRNLIADRAAMVELLTRPTDPLPPPIPFLRSSTRFSPPWPS
jgi:hypothetical protein